MQLLAQMWQSDPTGIYSQMPHEKQLLWLGWPGLAVSLRPGKEVCKTRSKSTGQVLPQCVWKNRIHLSTDWRELAITSGLRVSPLPSGNAIHSVQILPTCQHSENLLEMYGKATSEPLKTDSNGLKTWRLQIWFPKRTRTLPAVGVPQRQSWSALELCLNSKNFFSTQKKSYTSKVFLVFKF